MANKSVFASIVGKLVPRADTVNEAGGRAYQLSPKQALAQMATTGTFNGAYYASGEAQLDTVLVLALAAEVEAEFLAKAAIYAFEKGHMKDMPAMLLTLLASMQGPEFVQAFPRIVTSGRMLRNFVQIVRSGVTGRKSLGTRPKKMVQAWLNRASDQMILNASVGNDPSLSDVIKMVHPKPEDPRREALYAWLIGKPHDSQALPENVQEFEAFKRDLSRPVPDVPFQMLTSLELTTAHWVQIAHKASWQMLRQNLNAFARHGAFEVEGFTNYIAGRIADKNEIRKTRVFPYQLMMAHGQALDSVPSEVIRALEDAMEIALSNLPEIAGNVVVCPDVSGSMASSVTGYRKGASSKVRCIDVAALTAAAILSKNPSARVMPFAVDIVKLDLDPKARIMVNAQKLAAIGGGGTDCSAPLAKLAQERAKVDLALFVSDNESWVGNAGTGQRGTRMMEEWQKVKAINPEAKLVCIDIQPYVSTQAVGRDDILNVGGFSDAVFDVVAQMLNSNGSPDHWGDMIETISL